METIWNCEEFEDHDALEDKAYMIGFRGVTHAYAMNTDTRDHMLVAYTFTPIIAVTSKEEPRQTRAYREMLRVEGKKVPKIDRDALRDELYVVPGAAMTPADIVKVLRDFIEQIEKHGMFIGKYKDEYIKERISGVPRFHGE
jgi:hypothetical protein